MSAAGAIRPSAAVWGKGCEQLPAGRWVMLDLDGTLCDSLPTMLEVYREFLRTFGVEGSREEFEKLNGPSLREIVRYLREQHDLPGSEDELFAVYRQRVLRAYGTRVQPMPGAGELLVHLREMGRKLALVTSSDEAWALPAIKRWGWLECFDELVFGDMVSRAKPAPDIYEHALRLTGAKRYEAVVLEDSSNGQRSAQDAGLAVFRLLPGGAIDGNSERAPAGTLQTLTGFPELLASFEMEQQWRVLGGGPVVVTLDGSGPSGERVEQDKEARDHLEKLNRQREEPYTDNAVFHVNSWRCLGDGHWVCSVSQLRYRHFLYARDFPRLARPLVLLGVSAVTVRQGSGGLEILLGKRSAHVTQYPGALELAPSGSVDQAAIRGEGLDLVRAIGLELEEETGLSAEDASISILGLVLDCREQVVDVCCEIALAEAAGGAETLKTNEREYPSLMWMPCAEAEQQFSDPRANIVPTSRGLWQLWRATLERG